MDGAVPDLQDPLHGRIQKIPVVRNQHQRVRICLQIIFEPVPRFQIQMVRRLIQQQQARLLQQELGKRDAHLPSAAEILAGTLHVLLRETQAQQHGSGFGFNGVSLLQTELLGQDGVALERLFVFGPLMLHVRQFMLQLPDFALHEDQRLEDGEHFLQQRAPAHEKPVLRKIAESQVSGADHFAFIRRASSPRESS